MKKKVFLKGEIAKFGEVYTIQCNTIMNIMKLLSCQIPGFKHYIIEAAQKGVSFEIVTGDTILEYPEELLLNIKSGDIIITEVPSGAKSGEAKIIAAVVIAAFMYYTGGFTAGEIQAGTGDIAGQGWAMSASTSGQLNIVGQLFTNISINLARSGLAQLLAPGPEVDNKEVNQGYMFDGTFGHVKKGYAIPVVYGEILIPGSPVSAGFSTKTVEVL